MKKTKPKRFTNDFKAKVINEYLEGKGGRRALAKKYGLIPSTIKYLLDTRDKNGKIKEDKRKTRSGRLKKDPTIDDYKERYEILKKYQAFLKARQKKQSYLSISIEKNIKFLIYVLPFLFQKELTINIEIEKTKIIEIIFLLNRYLIVQKGHMVIVGSKKA